MNWKVCATLQSAVALTFHGVALPSIELVEPQVDYHTYTTAIIYHTRNVFNIHCHVYTYICCQAYRHFLQCYDRCHRVLLTWPDRSHEHSLLHHNHNQSTHGSHTSGLFLENLHLCPSLFIKCELFLLKHKNHSIAVKT